MSAPNTTPGPWVVVEEQSWPFGINLVAPGGEEVASFCRHAYGSQDRTIADVMAGMAFTYKERPTVVAANAKQIANAHLLASAPELYEALEKLADFYESGGHIGNIDEAIAVAAAALRKARGEAA